MHTFHGRTRATVRAGSAQPPGSPRRFFCLRAGFPSSGLSTWRDCERENLVQLDVLAGSRVAYLSFLFALAPCCTDSGSVREVINESLIGRTGNTSCLSSSLLELRSCVSPASRAFFFEESSPLVWLRRNSFHSSNNRSVSTSNLLLTPKMSLMV